MAEPSSAFIEDVHFTSRKSSVLLHTIVLEYMFYWNRAYECHASQTLSTCTSVVPRSQEGPTQHVPVVTTETVEWCAPVVLQLAWCETFSHRVDPSELARFFIMSSFSMLRANSMSKFLLWANFLSKILLWANLIFESSFSLLWANFLRFEQFVCR